MTVSIQQGTREGEISIIAKQHRWFEVARWTMYYRAAKSPPKVREEQAEPVKQLIEPGTFVRLLHGGGVTGHEQ